MSQFLQTLRPGASRIHTSVLQLHTGARNLAIAGHAQALPCQTLPSFPPGSSASRIGHCIPFCRAHGLASGHAVGTSAISRTQSGGAARLGIQGHHCEVLGHLKRQEPTSNRSLSLSVAQAQAEVIMTSPAPHTALSVFVNDAQVAIQPKGPHASSQVETLSINLDTGKIQVLAADAQFGTAMDVMAVLGVCKLHAGNALVVVTSARKVAQIKGADVFEVVDAKVVASNAARSNQANKGLLRLLEEAVNSQGAGKGLCFSYFYDITQNTQRAAGLAMGNPDAWATQLPVQRASGRFFWNKAIAAPLLSAGAHSFVQPCMMGFVQQLPGLQLREPNTGKSVTATVTLVARRSVNRAGTRQWRRGADTAGNVANFAETEQVITIDGPASSPLAGTTASYIITRGSIPLLWTQLPNIKYKPTTVIAPSDLSGPAHDKHFNSMVEQYESVVAINLINHHGTEGKLEAAFRSEATRLVSSNNPTGRRMRYVAFDFHQELSGQRYHRLSFLWDEIVKDVEEQSFCMVGGQGAPRSQRGVMRINCIDCLDRTNVVQGVLARKSFEAVLQTLGLLGKGVTLPDAYPAVERQFKILWADHGDMLATQYAGTGAMKSGYTRTGKRTIGGAIDDGVKAVVRYYLNNYQDGIKQDAIDLLTGTYTCDTINAPPIKPQPSPLVPMVLSLLAIGIAAHNMMAVLSFFFTSHPSPSMPEAGAAADAATGLLGSARRLASTIIYTPPHAAASSATPATITMAATSADLSETVAAHGGFPAFAGSVVHYVVVPLALGAGLLMLILKNGKYLVNSPQLCPQLAITVQRPAKESKKAA